MRPLRRGFPKSMAATHTLVALGVPHGSRDQRLTVERPTRRERWVAPRGSPGKRGSAFIGRTWKRIDLWYLQLSLLVKYSQSLFEKYQAASRLSIKRVIATYTNVSLVVGNSS